MYRHEGSVTLIHIAKCCCDAMPCYRDLKVEAFSSKLKAIIDEISALYLTSEKWYSCHVPTLDCIGSKAVTNHRLGSSVHIYFPAYQHTTHTHAQLVIFETDVFYLIHIIHRSSEFVCTRHSLNFTTIIHLLTVMLRLNWNWNTWAVWIVLNYLSYIVCSSTKLSVLCTCTYCFIV